MKPKQKLYICSLLTVFLFCLFPGLLAAKSSIQDARIFLAPGVMDLRGNHQFRRIDENSPKGFHSPADLEVGSIFIDANNEARKVVAIYEERGKTIIDTVQPEIEEAMLGFEIPEQEIKFSADDIDPSSIQEGVTVLNPDFSSMNSSRATIPTNSKWLETDPAWMGEEIVTIKIDKTLYKSKKAGDLLASDDDEDENKTGDDDPGGEAGDTNNPKSELNVEVSGEIKLEGYLRLVGPTLDVAAKSPRIKFNSPLDWFSDGVAEHIPGYVKAEFTAAQQLDCVLIGTASLSAELKIPLYGYGATAGGSSFYIGVYLKVTLEGEIVVKFDISEYTNFTLRGHADIAWPFIPYDVRFSSSSYANFAVRPSIEAEIEKRAGLYLGFDGSILGFNVLAAEAGGGIYANVQGWMVAKGLIGYNTDEGSYGSLSDWLYEVTLELGGYIEGNMSILWWDINLFEKKWPFLTTTYSGELNL